MTCLTRTPIGCGNNAQTPATRFLAGSRQVLSEGTALPHGGTLVIDDVHAGDKDKTDGEEDRAGDFKMLFTANVAVEGRGGDGEDAGEEVASPTITAGRGGRVWAVGADHVVDSGHVDRVIGNSDDSGEDHRADPVQRGTRARPRKPDEAGWKTGRGP